MLTTLRLHATIQDQQASLRRALTQKLTETCLDPYYNDDDHLRWNAVRELARLGSLLPEAALQDPSQRQRRL